MRYQTIPFLILVSGFLLGCASNHISSSDGKKEISPERVFGTWRVTGHKALPVTAMNPDRIRSLVDGDLSLSEDHFRFDSTGCDDVSYQYELVENPDQYLEGFKISRDYLDINSETMQVIGFDCRDKIMPGHELFLLPNENKSLWYHGDGVFFYVGKVEGRRTVDSFW